MFKSAMSLDGKVATQTGDSKWISGEQSRELVHRWRSEVDAICVGIGTALSDNPMLTARTGGDTRQPKRVIFDSQARLPHGSNLVRTAPETPLIVIVSRAAERAPCEALRAAGAELIVASGGTEAERVSDALTKLGDGGVQSLLLEGGSRLAGSFFDAGEIDEVRIFVAPIAVGGRGARVAVEGEGSDSIAESQHALAMEWQAVGEDLLIDARLKEW